MHSEHYDLGYADGQKAAPRRSFLNFVFQTEYDKGYDDGWDAGLPTRVAIQNAVRATTHRGGC